MVIHIRLTELKQIMQLITTSTAAATRTIKDYSK